MSSMPYLLVIFCVIALTVGQLLFKIVSDRLENLWNITHDGVSLSLLCAAFGLYATSTIAWIVALRSLPLSRAYPFIAFGFILVPLAAQLWLNEPLTLRMVAGGVLITLGVWIAAG